MTHGTVVGLGMVLIGPIVGCLPVERTVYVVQRVPDTTTTQVSVTSSTEPGGKQEVEVGPGADVDPEVFYGSLTPYGAWVDVPGVEGPAFRPEGEDFAPYRDGRWVHTEHGMTWEGEEPYSWAVYHYGRWIYYDGWAWVPGSEWAPAWVDWRCGSNWAGWAPIPAVGFWAPERSWSFVALGQLFSPYVGRHLRPRSRDRWRHTHAVPRSRGARRGRGYSPGPSLADLERRGVDVRRSHRGRQIVRVSRPTRPVVRAERPSGRPASRRPVVRAERPGGPARSAELYQRAPGRRGPRVREAFARRLSTARTFAEHERAAAETRWYETALRHGRRPGGLRPGRIGPGPLPPPDLAAADARRWTAREQGPAAQPIGGLSRWRTRRIGPVRRPPRYTPSPPAPGGTLSVVGPAAPAVGRTGAPRPVERQQAAPGLPPSHRLESPIPNRGGGARVGVATPPATPGVRAAPPYRPAGYSAPRRSGGGRLFVTSPPSRRPSVQSAPRRRSSFQRPSPSTRLPSPTVFRSPPPAAIQRPRTRAVAAPRVARPVARARPASRVRARPQTRQVAAPRRAAPRTAGSRSAVRVRRR